MWGGPPVLGSPLGTTPPSASRSVDDADFIGEKRVQGDPRGPGGPPHNFGRIRSFGKKYVALAYPGCGRAPQRVQPAESRLLAGLPAPQSLSILTRGSRWLREGCHCEAQHLMHLLCTDARKPLQELVNRRALVEVFEKGKHTETSAGEAPQISVP